jgi:hypothetical protein
MHPAPEWQFWHETKWHSFLEQAYGFVNGIGLIVGMAFLARRTDALDNQAERRYWTEIVAVTVAVPALVYLNMVKNIADWTQHTPSAAALPKVMRIPLIGVQLSSMAWFNVFFGLAAIAFVMLLSVHTKRRLAILEQGWLGRGQLLFIVILWTFVIGNFGRALLGFNERRLFTEGVITINAVFATMMILLVPRTAAEPATSTTGNFHRLVFAGLAVTLLVGLFVPPLETVCERLVYGDAPVHHPGPNVPLTRFGPHAAWRERPLVKGSAHR